MRGMTDSELIDKLGGPSALSRLLGLKRPSVVQNWRKRGIPARVRLQHQLLFLAAERGQALPK
jgi:hypothetical protein